MKDYPLKFPEQEEEKRRVVQPRKKIEKQKIPIQSKKIIQEVRQENFEIKTVEKRKTLREYQKIMDDGTIRFFSSVIEKNERRISDIFFPELVDCMLLKSYDIKRDIGIKPMTNTNKIKRSFILPILPSYKSIRDDLKIFGNDYYTLQASEFEIDDCDILHNSIYKYVTMKGNIRINQADPPTPLNKKMNQSPNIPVKVKIIPLVFQEYISDNIIKYFSEIEQADNGNFNSIMDGFTSVAYNNNNIIKRGKLMSDTDKMISWVFDNYMLKMEKKYRSIDEELQYEEMFAKNFWDLGGDRYSAYNLKGDLKDKYSHQKLYGIFDSPLFIGTFDKVGGIMEELILRESKRNMDAASTKEEKKKNTEIKYFAKLMNNITKIRKTKAIKNEFFHNKTYGGKSKGKFHKNYLIIIKPDVDRETISLRSYFANIILNKSIIESDNISGIISQISWNMYELQQKYGLYYKNLNPSTLFVEKTRHKIRADLALMNEADFVFTNRDVILWREMKIDGSDIPPLWILRLKTPEIGYGTIGLIDNNKNVPIINFKKDFYDDYDIAFCSPRIIEAKMKGEKDLVQRFEDNIWSVGLTLMGILLSYVIRESQIFDNIGMKNIWPNNYGLNTLAEIAGTPIIESSFFGLYMTTKNKEHIKNIFEEIIINIQETISRTKKSAEDDKIRKDLATSSFTDENTIFFVYSPAIKKYNPDYIRDLNSFFTVFIGMMLYKRGAKDENENSIDPVKHFEKENVKKFLKDKFNTRNLENYIISMRSKIRDNIIKKHKKNKKELQEKLQEDKKIGINDIKGNTSEPNKKIQITEYFNNTPAASKMIEYLRARFVNFDAEIINEFEEQKLREDTFRVILYNIFVQTPKGGSYTYESEDTYESEEISGSYFDIIEELTKIKYSEINDKNEKVDGEEYLYTLLTKELYFYHEDYMPILNKMLYYNQTDRAIGKKLEGRSNEIEENDVCHAFFKHILNEPQLEAYYNPYLTYEQRKRALTSKDIPTKKVRKWFSIIRGSYNEPLKRANGQDVTFEIHDHCNLLHNIKYKYGLYNKFNWKTVIQRNLEFIFKGKEGFKYEDVYGDVLVYDLGEKIEDIKNYFSRAIVLNKFIKDGDTDEENKMDIDTYRVEGEKHEKAEMNMTGKKRKLRDYDRKEPKKKQRITFSDLTF